MRAEGVSSSTSLQASNGLLIAVRALRRVFKIGKGPNGHFSLRCEWCPECVPGQEIRQCWYAGRSKDHCCPQWSSTALWRLTMQVAHNCPRLAIRSEHWQRFCRVPNLTQILRALRVLRGEPNSSLTLVTKVHAKNERHVLS